MPTELVVRLPASPRSIDYAAVLDASGDDARAKFDALANQPGVHLFLRGNPSYAVTLHNAPTAIVLQTLNVWKGRRVLVRFPLRPSLRRVLEAVVSVSSTGPGVIDLTDGRFGAAPLFLLPDGTFSTSATDKQAGLGARAAIVSAARWISTRRTSSFERLFAPDLFHPEKPQRLERLSAVQAQALIAQIDGVLAAATVGSTEAQRDAEGTAQLRSACLTVLSHIVATAQKDPGFRAVADQAAARIFTLVDAEKGATSHGQLRAHAIMLLSQRGPALSVADRTRAQGLVRTLVREAPPYKEMKGAWNFAMCSASEFHEGEVEIVEKKYGFKPIAVPQGAPAAPGSYHYTVLEAPFKNPNGEPIRLYSRAAWPTDENHEMGSAFFHGIMINRHAQLGSFDMRATMSRVNQVGYKLMINSQCAGLTTRYALTRMFPDADIYSSWDSTYFRTEHGGDSGKVIASEGVDCFIAMLQGMAASESHGKLSERMRKVQWYHEQASAQRDFVQFVGPAHPLVVARFADINQDGKSDLYDGFLDFGLREIAEDIRNGATPRDPGVPSSQIGGEAARGLGWAAGSMDRVTQYSDIWAGLPGDSERFYAFEASGFFSHKEPPSDVPTGKDAPRETLGKLPSVCRFVRDANVEGGLRVEMMVHAWLSHAGKEHKRLLCAAEAMWRAFDLGHLPKTGLLAKPLGQRGAVLLTLAGLLEFPADQNYLDGLWSATLKQLNLPDVSRSTVRACITDADHDASNYYGSFRGLKQLIGDGGSSTGDLGRADALAYARLKSDDPKIGRAGELPLVPGAPPVTPPLVA